MKEEDSGSGTFADIVAEIADLAFSYGIRKVGGIDPREVTKEQLGAFAEACHEGYALAQDRLVLELCRLETAIGQAKALQKEAHRQRDRARVTLARELAEALHYHEMVLRNIANGIAWTLVGGHRWVVRRFYQGRTPGPLSASNLQSAIAAANQINQDRRKFALISDLTSCVQIGDLLVADRSTDPATAYSIELKQGQKNLEILESLENLSLTRCERAAWFFAMEQGEKGVRQAERIMRQEMRAAEAMKIIRLGEGVDTISGKPIMIPEQVLPEETYDEDLEAIVEAARTGGEGAAVLHECLWIAAYDTERVPFPSLMFKDYLHHELLKREDCLLPESPQNVTAELVRMRVVPYPIADLRQAIMTPTSLPLFLRWLRRETILDIALGRIRVYLYLDLDQFLARSQRYGLGGRWQTRRERRQVKAEGYFRSVGKLPVFERGGAKVSIAGGLIAKMLFDGATVDSVLFNVYAMFGSLAGGAVPGAASAE